MNLPDASFREKISRRGRAKILGLSWDDLIKYFFGGNAVLSVVVLALIMYFLFREGAGFFPQNHANLVIYRHAGLEYVDYMRDLVDQHREFGRSLNSIRLREFQAFIKQGVSIEEANNRLKPFDAYAIRFSDTITGLNGIVSDTTEIATTGVKERAQVNEDRIEQRAMLQKAGRNAEADAVVVENVDYVQMTQPIRDTFPLFQAVSAKLKTDLSVLAAEIPTVPTPALQAKLDLIPSWVKAYSARIDNAEAKMKSWDLNRPVSWYESFTSFAFGRQWLTASFWQDWYGIVPLFVGSLMISTVALIIAVPLSVGSAIYVNQIASSREQTVIKPAIEFIAAIPSVVLGFFGIAVLGGAIGYMTNERLSIMTAGCLLALMAIPTIFSLAEDALNNVPKAYVEASSALGATKLQTIVLIMIPSSLSGIISAILLGLGRVIGETMVVLLCAGNRIAIPDFSAGISVFFQPVHTMTGIIAQEMGEVVRGSIHYRALFMVGIALFLISLLLNYLAQIVVRKYRISIG